MQTNNPRVLVLGASGMLGNAIFRYLSDEKQLLTFGTVRSLNAYKYFRNEIHENVIEAVDLSTTNSLERVFSLVKPDIVINCIGLVKQLNVSNDPIAAISINSILPHSILKKCDIYNARFVHISTDCVFSGKKGNYLEDDFADADDIYGRSKFLGEVNYSNALTLRTSIIGHELERHTSLINWFLSQEGTVNGFEKAIFSGLPTCEIARVISEYIIPNVNLKGVYHLSANPINKYDLLCLVKKVYKKKIEILKEGSFVIDRSLNSKRFRDETGYVPPDWEYLVNKMYEFQ